MDAQLNALPTLPAVSRTEGSGDPGPTKFTRHSPLPLQRGIDGRPRRFTAIMLNVSRRRFGGPAGVEPQSPGERIRRCFTLGRVRYNSRRDRSRSGWSRRGTTRDRGSSAPGRVFGFGLKVHNERYRHPFAADHVPVTLPCNEPGSGPWLTRRRLAITLDPARPSLD